VEQYEIHYILRLAGGGNIPALNTDRQCPLLLLVAVRLRQGHPLGSVEGKTLRKGYSYEHKTEFSLISSK
jgi:hypothetical protein